MTTNGMTIDEAMELAARIADPEDGCVEEMMEFGADVCGVLHREALQLCADLARVTAKRDELRAIFDALPRCVFASCDNVATWRLDDFSVGCDAHREATVKGSPRLASHPELPYAKALRAMLAKKVTP